MSKAKSGEAPDSLTWWTPFEVANLLRYHISTILRWCQTEKIRAAKLPGGTWRIHESAVNQLQACGLPEQRRQETAKVDPVWENVPDRAAAIQRKARSPA